MYLNLCALVYWRFIGVGVLVLGTYTQLLVLGKSFQPWEVDVLLLLTLMIFSYASVSVAGSRVYIDILYTKSTWQESEYDL